MQSPLSGAQFIIVFINLMWKMETVKKSLFFLFLVPIKALHSNQCKSSHMNKRLSDYVIFSGSNSIKKRQFISLILVGKLYLFMYVYIYMKIDMGVLWEICCQSQSVKFSLSSHKINWSVCYVSVMELLQSTVFSLFFIL